MKRCFAVLFATMLISAGIFAQETVSDTAEIVAEPADSGETTGESPEKEDFSSCKITKISIKNLKRTKESVILADLKQFMNRNADEATIKNLGTALMRQGMIEKYEFEFNQTGEGEVEITAKVSEKISFIPLPIVSYSSSGFMGGLMLIDTNAFGLKDQVIVGGIFSETRVMGMLAYKKAAKNYRPGAGISFNISNSRNEIDDTHKDEFGEYRKYSHSAGLSLEQKLFPFAEFDLGVKFGQEKFWNKSKSVKDELDGTLYTKFSGALKFHHFSMNSWFISEKNLSLSQEIKITLENDKSYGSYASIKFAQPLIFDNVRLIYNAGAFWGISRIYSDYEGNNTARVALFPSNFSSSRIAGQSAGLEVGVFRNKFLTFSLYGVFQNAVTRDFDKSFVHNCGTGGGFMLYLKKIAIPAMSLGIIYNINKSTWNCEFSIGMAM